MHAAILTVKLKIRTKRPISTTDPCNNSTPVLGALSTKLHQNHSSALWLFVSGTAHHKQLTIRPDVLGKDYCNNRIPSTLVNLILVFGRNNDRNVQRIVNGRFGDRLWTYLCISSNVFGPKTS